MALVFQIFVGVIMNVYVVTEYFYGEGYDVPLAVFSTEGMAEEFILAYKSKFLYASEVEIFSFVVDNKGV